MSDNPKTWPGRIYLQASEDCEIGEYPGISEDLTWCEDRQNRSDVEYIRADLASQPSPADREMSDEQVLWDAVTYLERIEAATPEQRLAAADALRNLLSRPAVQVADQKKDDGAKIMADLVHDNIVVMQAAWIEWRHGDGAERAMAWIENTLSGPGLIPEEDEPYATEAQAYFDANNSDPYPTCHCGRPSNILSMGKGYCSTEHQKSPPPSSAQEGESSNG